MHIYLEKPTVPVHLRGELFLVFGLKFLCSYVHTYIHKGVCVCVFARESDRETDSVCFVHVCPFAHLVCTFTFITQGIPRHSDSLQEILEIGSYSEFSSDWVHVYV